MENFLIENDIVRSVSMTVFMIIFPGLHLVKSIHTSYTRAEILGYARIFGLSTRLKGRICQENPKVNLEKSLKLVLGDHKSGSFICLRNEKKSEY